jgi:o-succinylbenzoate synthase
MPPRPHTLELHRVAMPLVEPFRVSVADLPAIETVLLRIVAEDAEAWIEAAPHALPFYSPDWAEGTFALLARIAPVVLAADGPRELQARLGAYRGNAFARAALDTAVWVLEAVRAGQPLHRHLGATRDVAEIGADFGILDMHEALLEQIEQAVATGFRRVKLKAAPGWDLAMVEAVRGRFPDLVVHVDCNGAYTLADAELFRALDDFGLAMIEQPLMHDDLVDHARLQEQLRTPICLDESVVSPRHARQALELGSCRAINVKPGRVGGLTNAREIVRLCAEAGATVWIGGMLESALGGAACCALGCLDGVGYPSDVFPTERFYARDLCAPELRFSTDPAGGRFVHAEPVAGLAPVPDPEVLAAWTVEQRTLSLR